MTDSLNEPDNRICPDCGTMIPQKSPHGLCPHCLLGTGLDKPPANLQVETRLLPENTQPGSVGMRLKYFGDYELIEEIARGGMGVVYKARQVSLDRIVAVKMILAGSLARERDIKRFQTEAEAAANLEHPGIVQIYEVGEHKDHHYFSMSFVEGESLADKIGNGQISLKQSVEYLKKIAESVAHAHAKGVIHRDLKPANILINQLNEPKITDFGLAKRNFDENELTETGQILGTPSYMPPEQATGNAASVDERSDVYSLGAILYELVTGRPPFLQENSLETLNQVVARTPRHPNQIDSSIPLDLATTCMKCLEKQKHDRYASAQELADDLGRFLLDKPIMARPIDRWEKTLRFARKRRKQLTVAAFSLTSVVLLTVAFFWTRMVILAHSDAQLCELWLTCKDGDLSVEVLHETRNQILMSAFPIPNQEPILLPHGSYRLRLISPNRLSEIVDLPLNEARAERMQISYIKEGRPEYHFLLGLDNRSALQPKERLVSLGVSDESIDDVLVSSQESYVDSNRRASDEQPFVELENKRCDLDRDNMGDHIFRTQNGLIARSGRDDKLLWKYEIRNNRLESCIAVTHKNNEKPNVVVVFRNDEARRIEAISAEDGKRLWARSIDSIFPKVLNPHWSAEGKSRAPKFIQRFSRYSSGNNGLKVARAGSNERPLVVFEAGGKFFFVLDALTGKLVWEPIEFRIAAERSRLSYDQDRSVKEVAFVFRSQRTDEPSNNPEGVSKPRRIVGYSIENGEVQYEYPIGRYSKPVKFLNVGGAIDDIMVSRTNYRARQQWTRTGRMLVSDLDTGDLLWGINLADGRLEGEVVAGPDINHDGINEIYLLSHPKTRRKAQSKRKKIRFVYFDVLSGKDGAILVSRTHELSEPSFSVNLKCRGFFGLGPDSHPMLVASFGTTTDGRAVKDRSYKTSHFISVSDGKLRHTLSTDANSSLQVTDFDNDGITDLFFRANSRGTTQEELYTIRGTTPEMGRGMFVPLSLWFATPVTGRERRRIGQDPGVTFDRNSVARHYLEIVKRVEANGIFAFPKPNPQVFGKGQSPNGSTVLMDCDQDGENEIFRWNDRKLTATLATTGTLLWQWDVPSTTGKVFGVLKDPRGAPIVIANSNDVLYGISFATGATLWKCDGYFTEVQSAHRHHVPADNFPNPPEQANLFLDPECKHYPPRFAFNLKGKNSPRSVTIIKQAEIICNEGFSQKQNIRFVSKSSFAVTGSRRLPWDQALINFNGYVGPNSHWLFFSGVAVFVMLRSLLCRKQNHKETDKKSITKSITHDPKIGPNETPFDFMLVTLIAWLWIASNSTADGDVLVVSEIAGWFVLAQFFALFAYCQPNKTRLTSFAIFLTLAFLLSTIIAGIWIAMDLRDSHFATSYVWHGWFLVVFMGTTICFIIYRCLIGLRKIFSNNQAVALCT